VKEKLLVLAKASPEISNKYEELVCVAGITESGEWRRIYPVPWEVFFKGSRNRFRKKTWIEYELRSREPSDHRPESRKIISESIKPLKEASFQEIEGLLKERVTTIEELEMKTPKMESLGVVIPKKVTDFIPADNKHYAELVQKGRQFDLLGNPAIKLEPPKFKYSYKFMDDEEGRMHEILCEDWEAVMLYMNCEKMRKEGKYPDEKTVHDKVKEKMLGDIFRKGRVYFIVGSHFRFPSFMIVGVVYPKKTD